MTRNRCHQLFTRLGVPVPWMSRAGGKEMRRFRAPASICYCAIRALMLLASPGLVRSQPPQPIFNVADPADPFIQAQASSLNKDPNQIFAFVRDTVAYQGYTGSV